MPKSINEVGLLVNGRSVVYTVNDETMNKLLNEDYDGEMFEFVTSDNKKVKLRAMAVDIVEAQTKLVPTDEELEQLKAQGIGTGYASIAPSNGLIY